MNYLALIPIFVATAALAETQCIRDGGKEVVLFDYEVSHCVDRIVPPDPPATWKLALSDENYGCWLSDGLFVHVTLANWAQTTYPAYVVEPISACKNFNDQRLNAAWEYEIEFGCENFGIDRKIAEGACRKALALAERYGESDPRLLRSVESLSVQTKDLRETEVLIKRAAEIRRKHFPSDFAGMMINMTSIAFLRRDQGDAEAYEALYLEAIEFGRRHLGDDHIEVVANTLILGATYFRLGKFREAEEQLLLGFARSEKHRAPYWAFARSMARSCARMLADIYQKQQKPEDEARYREIARRITEELRPPESKVLDDLKDPS
jgi:hypothetical protein